MCLADEAASGTVEREATPSKFHQVTYISVTLTTAPFKYLVISNQHLLTKTSNQCQLINRTWICNAQYLSFERNNQVG